MVTRSLTAAFASLLIAATASGELNLSPVISEYQGEGIKFKQLLFSDGTSKKITYTQPPGWDYTGSRDKLVVRPPDRAQAEGSITKVPLPKPSPFDETRMAELAEEALAAVPKDSTEVTMLSQETSPIVIGGKETFRVTMSYNFHGQNFGRAVMFMDRGSEQLRFQFVSRLEDFPELQRAFFASHFTWQNL